MVLAEIAIKLRDLSVVKLYYYTNCLRIEKIAVWGNSSELVYWGVYPEFVEIWDGNSWNLGMLTDLFEQFDFSEVM